MSTLHTFCYNQSPQPWQAGAQPFAPYPAADSLSIADGVRRVVYQERSVLVPVLKNIPHYYVAVVRGAEAVNVVQMRLDFSGAGKPVVRARPVLVPDSVRLAFPHTTFTSSDRPSDADITTLFWDVLCRECTARCGDALTRLPALDLDLPGVYQYNSLPSVFHYSGPQCFAATVYEDGRRHDIQCHRFLQTLSAVLQEALVRPARPFAQLLPYGAVMQQRVNHREYVGVVREGGSVDINVVHLNGRMVQNKVVFPTGQIPGGFNLVSRRLTHHDRDALLQAPVLAHWSRQADRTIVPVGGALPQRPCTFRYDQSSDWRRVDYTPYDGPACERIQTALAHICHSGGPGEVLVPIDASLPPPGETVSFFVAYRVVRQIMTYHIRLFDAGSGIHRVNAYLETEFSDTVPHLHFYTGVGPIAPPYQPLIFDILHTEWTRRIDQLLLNAPQATGAEFEYYDPTVRLNATAAARLERVLRVGPQQTSVIVPLPEEGPTMYAAVVRDANSGDAVLGRIVLMTTTLHFMRSPDFPHLPQGGAPMQLTPAQIRDLFEEPLFAHWQQAAADNPHDLARRSIPVCLELQAAGLDRELVEMVLRCSVRE